VLEELGERGIVANGVVGCGVGDVQEGSHVVAFGRVDETIKLMEKYRRQSVAVAAAWTGEGDLGEGKVLLQPFLA